jgi:hypothetical protein
MEKLVINSSIIGICLSMDVIKCSVYQMVEISNTKSSTYPTYTESSNKGMNSLTQMNLVT